MTTTAEPRVVVSWVGQGQPIVLALYGPEGEVAIGIVQDHESP